jgi:hypothetical protein
MNRKSELAWKLQDYIDNEEEVTPRIRENPHMSEGELMSDEEIENYIEDAMRSLYVMSDQGSKVYERCRDDFFNDLSYLASIGRISAEDYTEITKQENYEDK